jgi:hypothetical protein
MKPATVERPRPTASLRAHVALRPPSRWDALHEIAENLPEWTTAAYVDVDAVDRDIAAVLDFVQASQGGSRATAARELVRQLSFGGRPPWAEGANTGYRPTVVSRGHDKRPPHSRRDTR